MFEAYIMTMLELGTSPAAAADLVKVWHKRIWEVYYHYVAHAYEQCYHSGIVVIGIDKTSRGKGHVYITVGVDIAQGRVFKVVEGKDTAAVNMLAKHLTTKGSSAEQFNQVCIHMSPAFMSGVTT